MQVEYLYDKIKLFCLIPVALGKKKKVLTWGVALFLSFKLR